MKWTPDSIGALIIIAGGIGLRFLEIDGEVWSVVLIAVGWLFKAQHEARKK